LKQISRSGLVSIVSVWQILCSQTSPFPSLKPFPYIVLSFPVHVFLSLHVFCLLSMLCVICSLLLKRRFSYSIN
jgi:hypothetical protein